MTTPALVQSIGAKRVRASDRALRIALKAIQDAGLPVDKVCVSGGQIEIHCGALEEKPTRKKDGGLEKW